MKQVFKETGKPIVLKKGENNLSIVSQIHERTYKQKQNIFYYNFHRCIFGIWLF